MISQYWYRFLNNLGSWPCERNMETVNIFDDLDGKGLDIGHDGEYIFQNGNVIRLNIYPDENIDVVYDGVKIPFDNDTFDKIMLKCVLEHVDDPASILKEASRVLKLNGTMIIEVPFINPIHAAPDDYFRYTPNGLKKLIKDQKLHIASIFYTEDYNWAIKWILWLRLKENGEFGFKFLLKMTLLKYFINPLFLRSKTPNKNNFSQFAYIVKKVHQA